MLPGSEKAKGGMKVYKCPPPLPGPRQNEPQTPQSNAERPNQLST